MPVVFSGSGIINVGAPPPPPPSGFKFTPGHYLLPDTVDGSQSPYGSGAFKGWIDMLKTTGTDGIHYAGSPIKGVLLYYSWSTLQSAQGALTLTGFFNDFSYIQSQCPGCQVMIGVGWYNFAWHVQASQINSSVTGSAVPVYILNNPGTYGLGSNGFQGGYGVANWNSGLSQFNWTTAALWNTNVMTEWMAFWHLLANSVIPDGQGFTVNTHPNIEQVQDFGELSVDYITTGGGVSNPNPTYNRSNFDTQWYRYLPSVNATGGFTQTGYAPYPSFGLAPGGPSSYAEISTSVQLCAATKGMILSNADIYANTTPNFGMIDCQCYYIGYQQVPPGNLPWVVGGTDYRPSCGYSGTIQQLDWGSQGNIGFNNVYNTMCQGLYNTGVGTLKAQYMIWAGQDESNPSLGINLFPTYVVPFAKNNPVNLTRPGNF